MEKRMEENSSEPGVSHRADVRPIFCRFYALKETSLNVTIRAKKVP